MTEIEYDDLPEVPEAERCGNEMDHGAHWWDHDLRFCYGRGPTP